MTHEERFERRKAIAEWSVTHGAASAAKQFAVSFQTARLACRENGVVEPDRRREPNPNKSTSSFIVLRRLLNGETQQAIADDMGLTKQRISQVKLKAIEAGFIELKR